MALTTTQVSQLYVALFGRASEGEGNKNWVNHNKNMIDTAALMLDTPAANNYFGEAGKTNYGFVEVIYKNTLGFINEAEIAAWAANLDKGMSKAELVTLLLEEALSSKYAGGAPQNQLKNRIDVSDYMANNVETVAAENIASTQFKSLVHSNGKLDVTYDKSTVFSAKSAIDEMSGGTVIDGKTFTLTTSVEPITGTDANDLIKGVTSSLSSEKTLNSADVIDGGAGTDTAKFDLKTSFSGFTGDGKMTNVENVELTNEGTVARTFTGTGIDGVEKYTLNGAVDLVSMAEISNIDVADRTSDLSVTYASKVADGKADELTLSLNNVGTAEDESTTATEEKIVKVTIAGVETVNVEAAGVNVVDLDGVAAKAITASGAGSLKVTDVNAATKTIDASGMTGNVDLAMAKATAADAATLVSTGSGDDKVTVDIASDLTANATVAGGAGDDTLVLNGESTIQYTQSGFETIELGAGAKTISLKKTEDLANIIVNKNSTAVNTLASAGAIDLAVNFQTNSAGSLVSDHSGATTITVDTPTKAGTSTTNNTGATLSKSTSLNMTVAKDMVYAGTVTAIKATSVEMAIDGTVTSATVAAAEATSAVISSVAKDSTLTFTAGKVADLNITNAKKLDLTSSTLTGVETFTSTGAGDLTVTALSALNTATITNTGAIDLDTVGSNKDYALSVTSEGSKSFYIGDMATTNANITLNVIDSLGAVTVNKINAGTGAVNVTLATAGAATLADTITGKAVTIDVSGVLDTITYSGDITATGNVTFIGSELKANNLSTNASIDLQGTAQTVSLTGGLAADTFKITGNANSTTITVTGDLGADTSDSINITTTTGNQTIDISGLKNYDTALINAGAGADTIKLGAGADTVVFSGVTTALNGSDTISTFSSNDKYQFEKNGTDSVALANTTTGKAITLATTTELSTESTAIAVTNNKIYVAEVANKANIDTIADVVTALANNGVLDAVDIADSAKGYLILGGADDDTTHYIYGFSTDATAGITAAELTLVGTVTTDITNGIAGLTTDHITFA